LMSRVTGGPPDDRYTLLYELVANYPFETMFPPDYGILQGAVDPHMHIGQRRIDPVAQLKQATRAGRRGVVFKNAQISTVDVAHTASRVVAEWAEMEGLEPAEAFGAVVLGTMTGGINLDLVRYVIQAGGKVVWLPVLTSAQHLEKALRLPRQEARRR